MQYFKKTFSFLKCANPDGNQKLLSIQKIILVHKKYTSHNETELRSRPKPTLK